MPLTEEQMRSILSKDIKSKTVLVSKDNVQQIIDEHLKDGWQLKNKLEVNERYKITFTKVN